MRQGWEIAWHIWLQNAANYLTMKEGTCKELKINRVKMTNQAIERANALIEERGALGIAALSAAAVSLATLASTELNGVVPVVVTTKNNESTANDTPGKHLST